MARLNSVLLVDFDNLYGAAEEGVVNNLSNWLLWLEDGALSPSGKKRRFVRKRVYWNLQFDKYRPDFERAGFEAFKCRALAKRKISAGKSSADIVMTMDAIELAMKTRKLDEMIILTTDSDFVPVAPKQSGSVNDEFWKSEIFDEFFALAFHSWYEEGRVGMGHESCHWRVRWSLFT